MVLRRSGVLAFVAMAACAALGGCNPQHQRQVEWESPQPQTASPLPTPQRREVPHPLDLLLPETVKIHSFTGTRAFSNTGGVRGIDARVTALDGYGDVTKAFGIFRFELYKFRPNNADPKGALVERWNADLTDPKENMRHWQKIPPGYKFILKWNQAIPVGQRLVLVLVFSSPFTERRFDQRIFVAGE